MTTPEPDSARSAQLLAALEALETRLGHQTSIGHVADALVGEDQERKAIVRDAFAPLLAVSSLREEKRLDTFRQARAAVEGWTDAFDKGWQTHKLLVDAMADPRPDVAVLRSALSRVADVLDFADDAIDPPITTEIDTNIVRMALLDTEDAPPAELRRQVRALLGTDDE